MMFLGLGSKNKDQRGFTLIELLVTLAITGLITGAATTAIFQVFNVNTRSSNHMTAVHHVQNVGYWISRDAQMAQTVEPDALDPDGDGFPLKLSWTEWDSTKNVVTYDIVVGGEIERSHSKNPGGTSTMRLAQFINPDPTRTKCELTAAGVLIVTVTVTVGAGSQEASETRVYKIVPRPSI